MSDLKGTTDIWFASFLVNKGYDIKKFNVFQRGKGEYFFEVTDEKWKEEKIKFSSSEASRLKMAQIKLKDLVN